MCKLLRGPVGTTAARLGRIPAMGRRPSQIYLWKEPAKGTASFSKTGRNGKRISFGWYGGKYNHLDWLLPLLPEAHHYCEPYGGSAAVLLNRRPAAVETYNDLDGELVNFFRILRDKKDALVEAIG